MTTCIHCGMNYIAEHVCTSGGPVRVSVPDYKDAALAAKDAEIAKLREELTEARKVMEELVALSDMKRKVCAEHGWPDHDVRADYKRRISAAWESARAFLARKETP